MISRRGSGGSEETHPADVQRRLFNTGAAFSLRTSTTRNVAQCSLPAGLYVAASLLRWNRMLHRRFENMFRIAHRVRLAAIFRKSIHLFFRDQNHFLKRGGGGTLLAVIEIFVTIQTPLFFAPHMKPVWYRSHVCPSVLSGTQILRVVFFLFCFLSHDCPNPIARTDFLPFVYEIIQLNV